MRTALLQFSRDLDDLMHYLELQELETSLLALRVDVDSRSQAEVILLQLQNSHRSNSVKRRFVYNSVIISLYGFFEQYIEELLRKYALTISEIVPIYEKLPEKVVKRHIELSYALITRNEQERFENTTSTQQIIANLHSCMNNIGSYNINAEAFSIHTANFRMSVIEQSFINFGIDGLPTKIRDAIPFVEYLRNRDPTRNISRIKTSEAFSYLEHLVDRRNEVAHGILSSNILANDILKDYITFFHAFGKAIYDVIRRETLQYIIEFRQPINIGRAVRIYNNSIVCISLHNQAIKVGDTLIGQTPDNIYFDAIIEELRMDNIPYQEIQPIDTADVGIKVSFKAKDNQMFWLLPKDSE